MPVNAKVATHGQLTDQNTILRQVDNIQLNQVSDVSLDLKPRDIETMTRQGNDLLVTLENGDLVSIENFYADPNELSHLYLQGDEFAGDIFQVGLADTAAGTVPYTTAPVLTTAESALGAAATGASPATGGELGTAGSGVAGSGLGVAGVVAGGLAIAGGVAVAANSGSGSSSNTNSDTSSPDAPIVTSISDDAGEITGELSNGDSTDDTTPTISGTAEAGSSVGLYDGDTLLETVQADADGNWSVELSEPLAEGEHSLSAIATDAAGNASAPSDIMALTVDTQAPEAPVLEDTDGTTLTGTGEPGSTITVTNAEGEALGETTIDDDGNFTLELSPEQEDGTELTATATDAAGNESAPSAAITVPVDADITAPDAPTITSVSDDVEAVTGTLTSGDSTNDSLPTLTGNAEIGSTVTVMIYGQAIGTAMADANGAWTFTPETELADGEHAFTVTATDAAGNISVPSAEFALIVDTAAPEAPLLDETDGTSVVGTGEVGTSIEITNANGDVVGSAIVDADGTFSVELTPEQAAGSELTATATDAAGN
ncbi:Ig-like domain-containing protein, partial [Cobetia crustatorum]